jgi:hypothetical protein
MDEFFRGKDMEDVFLLGWKVIDGCWGLGIGWKITIQDCKTQFERKGTGLVPSTWSYSTWLGNAINIISPKIWHLWWRWFEIESGCNLLGA